MEVCAQFIIMCNKGILVCVPHLLAVGCTFELSILAWDTSFLLRVDTPVLITLGWLSYYVFLVIVKEYWELALYNVTGSPCRSMVNFLSDSHEQAFYRCFCQIL
ncbi:uncharacterized protein OCT59_014469 [Rhizophagus irregularis]|uniref:Uncharacterized protein n=1 Tax=Rhizophagus irregularis TaxID=588596 RepID=A0A916EAK8_9GLOM|nr:hypothetical protein OCT59_014469 [Rhizophagus irregularis]CAB4482842.1 unnamed protein product [Rhizophagus irregularis]CAB5199150.1 unnamed protein product [Rhizophagus irregularis]CAB5372380.1 unnamed protein product [Rhizophagus irregularis]CAG8730134.1 2564_t:CDS:1 [Rhizophagus irregularis]